MISIKLLIGSISFKKFSYIGKFGFISLEILIFIKIRVRRLRNRHIFENSGPSMKATIQDKSTNWQIRQKETEIGRGVKSTEIADTYTRRYWLKFFDCCSVVILLNCRQFVVWNEYLKQGGSSFLALLHPSSLAQSGCTTETNRCHWWIGVTPTKFSSNSKPCKEIIQTPTSLQLVWFPPYTTFRKLNPN